MLKSLFTNITTGLMLSISFANASEEFPEKDDTFTPRGTYNFTNSNVSNNEVSLNHISKLTVESKGTVIINEDIACNELDGSGKIILKDKNLYCKKNNFAGKVTGLGGIIQIDNN